MDSAKSYLDNLDQRLKESRNTFQELKKVISDINDLLTQSDDNNARDIISRFIESLKKILEETLPQLELNDIQIIRAEILKIFNRISFVNSNENSNLFISIHDLLINVIQNDNEENSSNALKSLFECYRNQYGKVAGDQITRSSEMLINFYKNFKIHADSSFKINETSNDPGAKPKIKKVHESLKIFNESTFLVLFIATLAFKHKNQIIREGIKTFLNPLKYEAPEECRINPIYKAKYHELLKVQSSNIALFQNLLRIKPYCEPINQMGKEIAEACISLLKKIPGELADTRINILKAIKQIQIPLIEEFISHLKFLLDEKILQGENSAHPEIINESHALIANLLAYITKDKERMAIHMPDILNKLTSLLISPKIVISCQIGLIEVAITFIANFLTNHRHNDATEIKKVFMKIANSVLFRLKENTSRLNLIDEYHGYKEARKKEERDVENLKFNSLTIDMQDERNQTNPFHKPAKKDIWFYLNGFSNIGTDHDYTIWNSDDLSLIEKFGNKTFALFSSLVLEMFRVPLIKDNINRDEEIKILNKIVRVGTKFLVAMTEFSKDLPQTDLIALVTNFSTILTKISDKTVFSAVIHSNIHLLVKYLFRDQIHIRQPIKDQGHSPLYRIFNHFSLKEINQNDSIHYIQCHIFAMELLGEIKHHLQKLSIEPKNIKRLTEKQSQFSKIIPLTVDTLSCFPEDDITRHGYIDFAFECIIEARRKAHYINYYNLVKTIFKAIKLTYAKQKKNDYDREYVPSVYGIFLYLMKSKPECSYINELFSELCFLAPITRDFLPLFIPLISKTFSESLNHMKMNTSSTLNTALSTLDNWLTHLEKYPEIVMKSLEPYFNELSLHLQKNFLQHPAASSSLQRFPGPTQIIKSEQMIIRIMGKLSPKCRSYLLDREVYTKSYPEEGLRVICQERISGKAITIGLDCLLDSSFRLLESIQKMNPEKIVFILDLMQCTFSAFMDDPTGISFQVAKAKDKILNHMTFEEERTIKTIHVSTIKRDCQKHTFEKLITEIFYLKAVHCESNDGKDGEQIIRQRIERLFKLVCKSFAITFIIHNGNLRRGVQNIVDPLTMLYVLYEFLNEEKETNMIAKNAQINKVGIEAIRTLFKMFGKILENNKKAISGLEIVDILIERLLTLCYIKDHFKKEGGINALQVILEFVDAQTIQHHEINILNALFFAFQNLPSFFQVHTYHKCNEMIIKVIKFFHPPNILSYNPQINSITFQKEDYWEKDQKYLFELGSLLKSAFSSTKKRIRKLVERIYFLLQNEIFNLHPTNRERENERMKNVLDHRLFQIFESITDKEEEDQKRSIILKNIEECTFFNSSYKLFKSSNLKKLFFEFNYDSIRHNIKLFSILQLTFRNKIVDEVELDSIIDYAKSLIELIIIEYNITYEAMSLAYESRETKSTLHFAYMQIELLNNHVSPCKLESKFNELKNKSFIPEIPTVRLDTDKLKEIDALLPLLEKFPKRIGDSDSISAKLYLKTYEMIKVTIICLYELAEIIYHILPRFTNLSEENRNKIINLNRNRMIILIKQLCRKEKFVVSAAKHSLKEITKFDKQFIHWWEDKDFKPFLTSSIRTDKKPKMLQRVWKIFGMFYKWDMSKSFIQFLENAKVRLEKKCQDSNYQLNKYSKIYITLKILIKAFIYARSDYIQINSDTPYNSSNPIMEMTKKVIDIVCKIEEIGNRKCAPYLGIAKSFALFACKYCNECLFYILNEKLKIEHQNLFLEIIKINSAYHLRELFSRKLNLFADKLMHLENTDDNLQISSFYIKLLRRIYKISDKGFRMTQKLCKAICQKYISEPSLNFYFSRSDEIAGKFANDVKKTLDLIIPYCLQNHTIDSVNTVFEMIILFNYFTQIDICKLPRFYIEEFPKGLNKSQKHQIIQLFIRNVKGEFAISKCKLLCTYIFIPLLFNEFQNNREDFGSIIEKYLRRIFEIILDDKVTNVDLLQKYGSITLIFFEKVDFYILQNEINVESNMTTVWRRAKIDNTFVKIWYMLSFSLYYSNDDATKNNEEIFERMADLLNYLTSESLNDIHKEIALETINIIINTLHKHSKDNGRKIAEIVLRNILKVQQTFQNTVYIQNMIATINKNEKLFKANADYVIQHIGLPIQKLFDPHGQNMTYINKRKIAHEVAFTILHLSKNLDQELENSKKIKDMVSSALTRDLLNVTGEIDIPENDMMEIIYKSLILLREDFTQHIKCRIFKMSDERERKFLEEREVRTKYAILATVNLILTYLDRQAINEKQILFLLKGVLLSKGTKTPDIRTIRNPILLIYIEKILNSLMDLLKEPSSSLNLVEMMQILKEVQKLEYENCHKIYSEIEQSKKQGNQNQGPPIDRREKLFNMIPHSYIRIIRVIRKKNFPYIREFASHGFCEIIEKCIYQFIENIKEYAKNKEKIPDEEFDKREQDRTLSFLNPDDKDILELKVKGHKVDYTSRKSIILMIKCMIKIMGQITNDTRQEYGKSFKSIMKQLANNRGGDEKIVIDILKIIKKVICAPSDNRPNRPNSKNNLNVNDRAMILACIMEFEQLQVKEIDTELYDIIKEFIRIHQYGINQDTIKNMIKSLILLARQRRLSEKQDFFQLFDYYIGTTLFKRFQFIFYQQNWEKFKESYWIQQALLLLLSSISRNSEFKREKEYFGMFNPLEHNDAIMWKQDEYTLRIEKKLMELRKSELEKGVKGWLIPLIEMVIIDPHVTDRIWLRLFPQFWDLLSCDEKVRTAGMIDDTFKNINLLNASMYKRINPMKTLIEGILICEPLPKICPEIIEFSSKKNMSHLAGELLLEQMIYEFPRHEGIYYSLLSLYKNRHELDMEIGLKKLMLSKNNGLRNGLILNQISMWEAAFNYFSNFLNYRSSTMQNMKDGSFDGIMENLLINDGDLDQRILEDSWIQAATNTCQWEVLNKVADISRNPKRKLMVFLNLKDINGSNEIIKKIGPTDSFPITYLIGVYHHYLLSAQNNSNPTQPANTDSEFKDFKIYERLMAGINKMTNVIPTIIESSHNHIFQLLQFYNEILEFNGLLADAARPLNIPVNPKNKQIINNFRYRLPSKFDDFLFTKDLLEYRNILYDLVPKLSSTVIKDTQIKNQLQDICWNLLKISKFARKHNLMDVACIYLKRLESSIPLSLQSERKSLNKITESLKLAISFSSEWQTAISAADKAIEIHSSTDHIKELSEIYRLRAEISRKIDKESKEIGFYFQKAVNICPNSHVAWKSWASFLDERFCKSATKSDDEAKEIIFAFASCITYKLSYSKFYLAKIFNIWFYQPSVGETVFEIVNYLPPWIWMFWLPQIIKKSYQDTPCSKYSREILKFLCKHFPQIILHNIYVESFNNMEFFVSLIGELKKMANYPGNHHCFELIMTFGKIATGIPFDEYLTVALQAILDLICDGQSFNEEWWNDHFSKLINQTRKVSDSTFYGHAYKEDFISEIDPLNLNSKSLSESIRIIKKWCDHFRILSNSISGLYIPLALLGERNMKDPFLVEMPLVNQLRQREMNSEEMIYIHTIEPKLERQKIASRKLQIRGTNDKTYDFSIGYDVNPRDFINSVVNQTTIFYNQLFEISRETHIRNVKVLNYPSTFYGIYTIAIEDSTIVYMQDIYNTSSIESKVDPYYAYYKYAELKETQPDLSEREIKQQIFYEMLSYLKPQHLAMFLHKLFASSEELCLFRKVSTNYMAAFAFLSITMHLKPLSLQDILLCKKNCRIIFQHATFNSDDSGKNLESPKIPFRLTRNIENFIQQIGIEGPFSGIITACSFASKNKIQFLKAFFNVIMKDLYSSNQIEVKEGVSYNTILILKKIDSLAIIDGTDKSKQSNLIFKVENHGGSDSSLGRERSYTSDFVEQINKFNSKVDEAIEEAKKPNNLLELPFNVVPWF